MMELLAFAVSTILIVVLSVFVVLAESRAKKRDLVFHARLQTEIDQVASVAAKYEGRKDALNNLGHSLPPDRVPK